MAADKENPEPSREILDEALGIELDLSIAEAERGDESTFEEVMARYRQIYR